MHLRRASATRTQDDLPEIADMVQGNRASYAIHGNAYYDTPFGQLRFPVTLYSSR